MADEEQVGHDIQSAVHNIWQEWEWYVVSSGIFSTRNNRHKAQREIAVTAQ